MHKLIAIHTHCVRITEGTMITILAELEDEINNRKYSETFVAVYHYNHDGKLERAVTR